MEDETVDGHPGYVEPPVEPPVKELPPPPPPVQEEAEPAPEQQFFVRDHESLNAGADRTL